MGTCVIVLLPWLQVGWNVFDSILVALNLVELGLADIGGGRGYVDLVSMTSSSGQYGCLHVFSPVLCPTDASAETGPVVVDLPHVDEDNLDFGLGSEEPDSHSADHGLHLHHCWHAAVPGRLLRPRL